MPPAPGLSPTQSRYTEEKGDLVMLEGPNARKWGSF